MILSVEQTKLPEVRHIKVSRFEDYRGIYCETYNIEDYHKHGMDMAFVRDDISTSTKGVLRGIHYDNKTWKLIQCMYGKIYFVVIDMRPDSPRYLQWVSFILTSENRDQVLVPPHFGNGHLVLSNECIFHYKMSAYYDPAGEGVLRWDDPKANIHWPVDKPLLSLKDATAPFLK